MEEVEAGLLEGGIGWLAETILENLDTDKLDAWIRQVGLADETKKLRSEVERVDAVVADVKGRAIGNRSLARSLGRLRELLYDADDMVDELDYYRLHQQVQGDSWHGAPEPESADGHGAEQTERARRGGVDETSGSGGKKRSEVWQHFEVVEKKNGKTAKAKCNDCHTVVKCGSDNGTSVLHNHRDSGKCKKKRGATDQPPNLQSVSEGATNGNSAATGNSVGRKRVRTEGTSTDHVAANTHPWNKAELSYRIQQMTHQLQEAMGEVLPLRGSDYFVSSSFHQNTTSDSRLRTSSLLQRKMHGRVEEKNCIIKLITETKSDGVTVLPIVGIGGIGKTALAQFVYNDPVVESLFQQRVWVWVSNNFDEVGLTREMLDVVCHEKHEGLRSLAKLQDMLMSHMRSERFLLVLDDVWDDMNNCRLNKLLAPLKSNNKKGNVVIMTTRILSVAKRIGTVEPIKLGALNKEDSWLLFKSCAFGDENHEPCGSLSTIGQKLTDKLKGSPLAAETAGELLSEHHTVDHWNKILKNEEWKSLQLIGGTMLSLKRSYDQLPYHLQQCLLYCSIFPRSYQFCDQDLVRIWISQGFVKCRDSNTRLEEIAEGYLTLLVNSGFFQQVEREESSPKNQTCYAMCGLMLDFARLISRTDSATIDGSECTEILPTIRHLSILTDSSFCKDKDGSIMRNKRFEERLQSIATSVNKLRTLVLIGPYDPFFFQSLKNVCQKAQNLRVLHIATKCADFNSFEEEMVNRTHLRYIKLMAVQKDGALPQGLSMFYHLQVLDLGSDTNPTLPNGINNLVSLRHLVAQKGVYSSITSIGKMTSLQELHNFSVQNSSGLEIAQLQSMNELVHLGVSRLESVRNQQEAYGASLKDKPHLEKLHLSWRDVKNGYDSDKSYEIEYDSDISYDNEYGSDMIENENDSDMISEPSMDIGTEGERLPVINIDGSQSLEHFQDIASEVLEGLEPHHKLKHLLVFEYNGSTSPTWLASSLTCLQTLHLEDCGKWQRLRLERLWLLRKLVLIKMRNATEVSIPSLEELVLIGLPRLKICSCTSVRDLNSSLRVLNIKWCPALEVFPFVHSLKALQLHSCTALQELRIRRCESLNSLEGLQLLGNLRLLRAHRCLSGHGEDGRCLLPQSLEELYISEYSQEMLQPCFPENLTSLKKLEVDGNPSLTSLQLHSCTALQELRIRRCESLNSLEGLQSLGNLRLLRAHGCLSGHGEDGRCILPQSLEELYISGYFQGTLQLCFPSNITCLKKLEASYTSSLKYLALQSCTALEELGIEWCESLATIEGLQSLGSLRSLEVSNTSSLKYLALQSCTALEELGIARCESLATIEGLESLGSLRRLKVSNTSSLKYLALQSCTALEELGIEWCESLTTIEGLQSLGSLRRLKVSNTSSLICLGLESCTALEELTVVGCPWLTAIRGSQPHCSIRHLKVRQCPCLRAHNWSEHANELCPRLESLEIDDPSILTTSLCKHLTSLQSLELNSCRSEVARLTDEQESGLQLLTSLQELRFRCCMYLIDLPTGLHSLPSLKRLGIYHCSNIARLPEKGLPPSLEELDITCCGEELAHQSRHLASKLKVKIN